jgi:hypothetical protein
MRSLLAPVLPRAHPTMPWSQLCVASSTPSRLRMSSVAAAAVRRSVTIKTSPGTISATHRAKMSSLASCRREHLELLPQGPGGGSAGGRGAGIGALCRLRRLGLVGG